MRFFGVSQISWDNSPWKQLSLVNDEEVISLSHAKVYVFSDSVLCLGKMNQRPTSNTVWEQQLGWFKDSSQYRILDTIDGEPMEFEWNIFPGFTTWQLVYEVQKFMNKMSDPDQLQGRIIFMSMFNDIIWRIKDNEQECIANATLVSVFAKRFPAGRWSFLGLGSEIIYTLLCRWRIRLKLFFAQLFLLISSVVYGAVSDECEEYSTC